MLCAAHHNNKIQSDTVLPQARRQEPPAQSPPRRPPSTRHPNRRCDAPFPRQTPRQTAQSRTGSPCRILSVPVPRDQRRQPGYELLGRANPLAAQPALNRQARLRHAVPQPRRDPRVRRVAGAAQRVRAARELQHQRRASREGGRGMAPSTTEGGRGRCRRRVVGRALRRRRRGERPLQRAVHTTHRGPGRARARAPGHCQAQQDVPGPRSVQGEGNRLHNHPLLCRTNPPNRKSSS